MENEIEKLNIAEFKQIYDVVVFLMTDVIRQFLHLSNAKYPVIEYRGEKKKCYCAAACLL